jgi:small subunit ribosomal protein S6
LREYETTFIVQPEISEEGCADLLSKLDGVLEGAGGTRLLHDDQGKRRLAYDIQNFQKGRYVTTYFLDEGKAVEPFERVLRLEESVLRFLTVMRNPEVADIDGRKAEAAEEERIRAERARERAERDAEEELARQKAAREAAEAAAAEEAARQKAAAERAEEAEAAAGEAATPAEDPSAAAADGPAAEDQPAEGGER